MKILKTKIVHATKNHKCDLCFGKIDKGVDYINLTVASNERIYAFKEHFKCSEIASYLNMDEFNEGLSGDTFCEIILEEYAILSKKQGLTTQESFNEKLNRVYLKYLGEKKVKTENGWTKTEIAIPDKVTVLSTVPYQRCPLCEGTGRIPNDITMTGTRMCGVCRGAKIIPMCQINKDKSEIKISTKDTPIGFTRIVNERFCELIDKPQKEKS